MREVFTSQNITQVGYYKSVLDEAKIASFIRNENTDNPGMAGARFLPALCLIHDEDYAEAIRLLKSRQLTAAVALADWVCPACSETNPGNFEICWKCGASRPGD